MDTESIKEKISSFFSEASTNALYSAKSVVAQIETPKAVEEAVETGMDHMKAHLQIVEEKKEQGLAELHSVVASIDEKTQPLQDQLAGFTDFRRKYPDAVMTGTAMALALPSLLRRSLFRSVLWAGSGYFLSSVTLEWLRIQDGKKK